MKYIRGCAVDQIIIADDFFEAYKRCLEGKNIHKDEYGRMVGNIVAIPAFVNGLFACELYFKYLLGDKIKILEKREWHNLKKLYNVLDDNIKDKLKAVEFNPEYKLEDLLDDIGEGFKIWRYCFEDGNEKFGDKHPFLYTEYFINTYLPTIKEIAHSFYDK